MNILKISLIWIGVAVSAIYSAQASAPTHVLTFSDSEGSTLVIYSN